MWILIVVLLVPQPITDGWKAMADNTRGPVPRAYATKADCLKAADVGDKRLAREHSSLFRAVCVKAER